MLSIGTVCGKSFSTRLKVCIVETRSMAAQHDQVNGVDGLENSVSDGERPETHRLNVLERKIQELMTNMQLLEQNREIILKQRGRRSALSDGDAGQLGSHAPLVWSHDQVHEDESISASQFQESRHEESSYPRVLGGKDG